MDFPRVLVLGATGRLGTILRWIWPAGQGLWQGRRAPGDADPAAWLVCDPLADPAALARAAQGCGAVLGLAGVTPTTLPAGADAAAALAANVDLGLAAVRAGAAAGVPVLLASSAAVYGRQDGVLAETAPVCPEADYGRAKAEMERRAARLGAELGVPVTALRIGNVAGADAILGRWRPGFALDRFADSRTPRRSYIGPLGLAAVLGRLCRIAAARPGDAALPPLLNISAPGTVEMGALLDAAGLAWTPRPAPAGALPEVALDVAALQRLCPVAPAGPAELVAEWRALAQMEADHSPGGAPRR